MASQSQDRTDYTVCLLGTNTKYNKDTETLSIVMSLINSGSRLREETPLEHICGHNATIIDGPDTFGVVVYSRIQLGLLRVLEAIVSGKTHINIIAHSRGACEAIILTHLLQDIKNAPRDSDLTGILKTLSWISWLESFWSSALGQQLVSYLKENKDAIKTNIENVGVNAFYLDPVPGGAWRGLALMEWKHDKFCEVPQIVTKYNQIIFTNERSASFQGVIPTKFRPHSVTLSAFPGHHGTGSGNLIDQRKQLDPSQHPQLVCSASNVQSLIFGKIIESLKENGVVFQQPEHLVPAPHEHGLNLRKIAHQIMFEKATQWQERQLELYEKVDDAQNHRHFDVLSKSCYPTGRDSPSLFSDAYPERHMLVDAIPVGLKEGLQRYGFSPEKGFIDAQHKILWLQKLEYFLLNARDPIQALKKIIDYIIKNSPSFVEEDDAVVYVPRKHESRFKANEEDIVSTILNTVKKMYSRGLFNSREPQFYRQISRFISHYASNPVISDKIKCAIQSGLLARRSNLGIGQLMTRFLLMQALSVEFTTPILPDIQLRVLADVVFYLPKQNPDNGLYFLPQLDESTHALLPLDLSNRYQEFFSRRELNLLARPAIALIEEERNHPLPKDYSLLTAAPRRELNLLPRPAIALHEEERTHLLSKKYSLLTAAIGSLLIIAAAVAANIAAIPASVSIGAIIIVGLAIKLYQTYFSTHQESNLSSQLGLFSAQHDDTSSLIQDTGLLNSAPR